MAIRIEQNIFKTIVQMTREMDKAEQMKQAKTRLFDTVQQAVKDANEWHEVLTYEEDQECEQQHIDLEPEHPYIESISIRIRHWVQEQRLEVSTRIATTQYDEVFYEEKDYHYVGSLRKGMTQVESAVVENLTTVLDTAERYVIALAKVAPLIRSEIERLLEFVNTEAKKPKSAPQWVDGVMRVGSISYRENRIPEWLFTDLLEHHNVSIEQVYSVANQHYPAIYIS